MQSYKVSIQEGQFENVLAIAFAPVVALSELIKNSSDACMKKQDIIRIDIDTKKRIIRLKDNGYGLSSKDIKNLATVGFSSKMTKDNLLSRIDEPYAGSKGLGIMTAFNLCDRLKILTFSQEEKKAYCLEWIQGETLFNSKGINWEQQGTEVILYGVTQESIILLTMEEELDKLHSTSITYYIDNKNLPTIELYQDAIKKGSSPKIKIEDLYNKFKFPGSSRGYFIAKASFKYSNNKLTLSYEDNIKKSYNIDSYELDLTDRQKVFDFLYKYKIEVKPREKFIEAIKNFNVETYVDDFEGVYYIWRGRKDAELNYPYGVRIYTNNYGLYAYLNKDIDWLQHSEISQNIRATNYKLKNTFGYINFKNFNEEISGLKISNERNDFKENLAKKKFMYIMQKFVSTIFSTIDINIKNGDLQDSVIFKSKSKYKYIIFGESLHVWDLITTNLTLEEIEIQYHENVLINNKGEIIFNEIGIYIIKFKYGQLELDIKINVEEPQPFFEIKKPEITIGENNSYNLKNLIKMSTLKNLEVDAIQIYSNNGGKINKKGIFVANNLPGSYIIRYYYSDELSCTMNLIVKPAQSDTAKNIRNLFPTSCIRYPKISELINEISESYVRHPYICMIALRPLIEISLKAFMEKFRFINKIDHNFNVEGELENLLNKIGQNTLNGVNEEIKNRYYLKLKEQAKIIKKYYKSLGLNSHIHHPDTHPTHSEVLQSMRKFSVFINFIIESLNSKLEN